TLNPAVDYVLSLDALSPGEINRTKTEAVVTGGKGINVSWLLKALGVESTALGFIAGFTGEAVRAGVQAQGISEDFVTLDSGFTRINVKIHAGEETEINGNGPEIPQEKLDVFFRKLENLSEQDTLVISGSVPRTLPADIYAQIAERAQARGVRLVVDAAGELLRSVLRYQPYLVKPNRDELAALFGEKPETDADVLALTEKLQALGARNVLVSMAGDGALLRTEGGKSYKAPAAKGTVVNSVGAGDSMVGGFLAALECGEGFKEALALGTAAGGATAFSVGIADKEKIMAVYETVKMGVEVLG
ncbi:MAG: 1-phosphofructokinase, partial [Clostridia bacterium]|nr:1-phosphofructokinase [Clostridia bacterium]